MKAMNILYLSCHSILEYDEVKLFWEMGHKVFSMGSYANPQQRGLPRPQIKKAEYFPNLHNRYLKSSKENLDEYLVNWADVIIMMHNSRIDVVDHPQPWLGSNPENSQKKTDNNWQKLKRKPVIWRSIGQSTGQIEASLKPFRKEGLKIVRYSPMEKNIPGFVGSDATIRFYKDPFEFNHWQGQKKEVITLVQGVNSRKDHIHFNIFEKATRGLPRGLFGVDNSDLGEPWKGELSYQQLKNELRFNRVYFYTGTVPASYTLSFIEAWMTGIPVVAIGPKLFGNQYNQETYEVHKLIRNKETGFFADSIEELRHYVELLLNDDALAHEISRKARQAAIGCFGRAEISRQWDNFLTKLKEENSIVNR